jgi:hypothetical protein
VSEPGGRILVLTSCTATKAELHSGSAPAEELYAGQQHVRLMRGVRAYRSAGEPHGSLDLRIVSAGHGLVGSRTRLSSYDETFTGLARSEVRRRGAALGIPAAVSRLLERPWRLAIILLGDLYLHAAALEDDLVLGGPTIALASPNSGARLPSIPGLAVVPLHNREARRFSCGLTALKGDLAARLISRLIHDAPGDVPDDADELLAWLEAPSRTRPTQLSMVA